MPPRYHPEVRRQVFQLAGAGTKPKQLAESYSASWLRGRTNQSICGPFGIPLPSLEAKQNTYKILRQYSYWRYRSVGYVDCKNGRITRTSWSCRILIIKRHRCWRGRARVYSKYDYYDRKVYIHTNSSIAPPYRCIGVNYKL